MSTLSARQQRDRSGAQPRAHAATSQHCCGGEHPHDFPGHKPTSFLTTRRVLALFAMRLIMSTVMQHCADVPDEWWQSTEVAYRNVFGKGHLPWEWGSEELRSYLYPLPFDYAFRILKMLSLDSAWMVWLVPKAIACFIATGIDIQTYRLGARLDRDLGIIEGAPGRTGDGGGKGSAGGLTVAKLAFAFSAVHWFTGYIGVRTQSNVLEALLVVTSAMQTNFLSFLFFAGFGCALRMTCVVPLTPFALLHVAATVRARGIQGLLKCTVELVLMLCLWLALSMSVDFAFYNKWTLTPLNFFLFNVLKGHSAIFGTHPWHWYFSTAFPVVCLPFTLLYPLIASPSFWRRLPTPARWRIGIFLFSTVFTMSVYSLVPHKELRFFYPVVPLMLIVSACVFLHHPLLRSGAATPGLSTVNKDHGSHTAQTAGRPKYWLFLFLVVTNIITYLIISVGYRRGTLDVMAEVRGGLVLSKNATPVVIENLHILTGCYATAGYSYVHGRVHHLRTIDCTPLVLDEATSATALTERDVFVEHPAAFAQWVYDGVLPTDDEPLAKQLSTVVPAGGSWPLPDVIIAYTYAINDMRAAFLVPHQYVLHKQFYHTFYVFQEHEDLTIEIWKRGGVDGSATSKK